MSTYPLLTVGVEEEFILVGTYTLLPVPAVDAVVAGISAPFLPYHRREFHASQLEMVSQPCSSISQLHEQLFANRLEASSAAEMAGCEIMAIGAPLVSGPTVLLKDSDRYSRLYAHYGALSYEPDTCGQHVHVGVPNLELAVEVCNRLQVYLPTIQALSVNSPFREGVDTQFGSWRYLAMGRFPTVGPFPKCGSLSEYLETVDALKLGKVVVDTGNIYWYARPSAKYPTVEIRIGDVP